MPPITVKDYHGTTINSHASGLRWNSSNGPDFAVGLFRQAANGPTISTSGFGVVASD